MSSVFSLPVHRVDGGDGNAARTAIEEDPEHVPAGLRENATRKMNVTSSSGGNRDG